MYELLKTDGRETGKSWKPKALRKEGWVPGVIYGKGMDSVHFKVQKVTLEKFLHHSGRVFEVEVSGHGKHLVNLQDTQRDHLGNEMVHVAFHKLQAGQKTKVTVPIHWYGEALGHKAGGVIHHAYNEIELEGLPKDIPEYYEVNIEALEMNGAIHLSEMTPPKGCVFCHSGDIVIVACHPPRKEETTTPVASTEVATPELVGEETPVEAEKKAS